MMASNNTANYNSSIPAPPPLPSLSNYNNNSNLNGNLRTRNWGQPTADGWSGANSSLYSNNSSWDYQDPLLRDLRSNGSNTLPAGGFSSALPAQSTSGFVSSGVPTSSYATSGVATSGYSSYNNGAYSATTTTTTVRPAGSGSSIPANELQLRQGLRNMWTGARGKFNNVIAQQKAKRAAKNNSQTYTSSTTYPTATGGYVNQQTSTTVAPVATSGSYVPQQASYAPQQSSYAPQQSSYAPQQSSVNSQTGTSNYVPLSAGQQPNVQQQASSSFVPQPIPSSVAAPMPMLEKKVTTTTTQVEPLATGYAGL